MKMILTTTFSLFFLFTFTSAVRYLLVTDPDGSNPRLVETPTGPPPLDPEYEFTIEFGDGFEKQTGRLYAWLTEGYKYSDAGMSVELTKGNEKGIELTPGKSLTFKQRIRLQPNRLGIKWEKTGSEEGNVIKIKKVVVKSVEQPELVKEFTNNGEPLASGLGTDTPQFIQVKTEN